MACFDEDVKEKMLKAILNRNRTTLFERQFDGKR